MLQIIQGCRPDGNCVEATYFQATSFYSVKTSWKRTVNCRDTFRYDPAGRRTERVAANGLVTSYAYNADNSLKQLINLFANRTDLISQHDYTYDAYGNRSNHDENINGITQSYTYSYDALNRLISALDTQGGSQSQSYDPLNNLKSRTVNNLTTTYNHDAANQLTEVLQGAGQGGTRIKGFVYDAAGNLKQKCESVDGVPVTLTGSPATACSGTLVAAPNHSFTYDDQGRRLSKTVGTGVNAIATNYLYNGQDILAEYQSWSGALAHLTHGPGTDEPLQRVQGTAGQSYMQDGLGSVVAAVPHDAVNGGATVGTQRFDAWGNTVAQSSAAVPLYGYTGREPDATRLIYYRARYYDPAIQRFTQRDPIGWAGGINAYAYVGNNPVNLTDPSGTIPEGASNTGGTSYPAEGGSDNGVTCPGVADAGGVPSFSFAWNGESYSIKDPRFFMYAYSATTDLLTGYAVNDAERGLHAPEDEIGELQIARGVGQCYPNARGGITVGRDYASPSKGPMSLDRALNGNSPPNYGPVATPILNFAKSVVGQALEGIQVEGNVNGMVAVGVGGISSAQSVTTDFNYSNGQVKTCTVNTTCLLVGPIAGATTGIGRGVQTGTLTAGEVTYQLGLTANFTAIVGFRFDPSISSNGALGAAGSSNLGLAAGGAIAFCRQSTSLGC
jgi:RHS repeat-associated protein